MQAEKTTRDGLADDDHVTKFWTNNETDICIAPRESKCRNEKVFFLNETEETEENRWKRRSILLIFQSNPL